MDVNLDQDKDNKDDNDAGLVGLNIQQPTQEPLDKEVGFRTASGRIIQPSRGATKALKAVKIA